MSVIKRASVCVTNDLTNDQRVRKTCLALQKCGYSVEEIGRLLPDSQLFTPPYQIKRMKLWFKKGAFFYAEYNIRLFFYLLFTKTDLIFSNDLDTLLACFLVSRIRKKRLIYDTHEYFTEVPELVRRPKTQKIWRKIEEYIFPKLTAVITVNKSIANVYSEKYGKNVNIIRNIPLDIPLENSRNRTELNLPTDKKILILQGAGINVDRGAEELVLAMQFLPDFLLLIIGSGDVISSLKEMVIKLNIEEKVIFKAKMPSTELREYTRNADLGFAIDKDTNLNYHFSLPNKLFDYIHSNIPILASGLPEIKTIIEKYKIGSFISSHQPEEIANAVISMFNDIEKYNEMKKNTFTAQKELTWEKEEMKLLEIINNG